MHISGLYCYPIKSCAGTELQIARVGLRGITHDRQYMVVDEDTGMFVAQRQDNGIGIEVKILCQVRPEVQEAEPEIEADFGLMRINAPDMPMTSVHEDDRGKEMRVQVWKTTNIKAYDMGDYVANWFTEFLSRERPGKYRLVRIADDFERKAKIGDAQVGAHDAYPFMGITDTALTGLNIGLGFKGLPPLPMNRFRPSFTIGGCKAHTEDYMKVLKIGGEDGIVLDGMTLCERCPLPCTDQDTGVRTHEPSATLSGYRRGWQVGETDPKKLNPVFFGRNFNHRGPGIIRVGDPITVLEID